MLRRCRNKADKSYQAYGGRGISVCRRWLDFSNFLSDMGEKPDGLTIERIDNDKGYSSTNCRWATMKEQARNKRSSSSIKVGREEKTAAEWAEIYGIQAQAILYRIRSGWTAEDAVKTPTSRDVR